MAVSPFVDVAVGDLTVRLSNPDKVFFAERGHTKLDLVQYYLSVGEGALRGVHLRPTVLKRYPNGAAGEFFFQKRVPDARPEWLRTVTVAFPSGNTATELCPANLAHIIWAVNLGCIDLNPWAVRKFDTEHPDEFRVDLDPQPGVTFAEVKQVAQCCRDVLLENNMSPFVKTSGSRGVHLNVRIMTKWGFDDVRRAAVALAREVERRLPHIATSKWWKEERGQRVLIDYNQNARDRTVASAYSVRPNPMAMVSAPLHWHELDDCELEDFTMLTMPARFADIGDLHASIDDVPFKLDGLLELAARDERDGLGDAPWPPNFKKMAKESPRVAPSRKKSATRSAPAGETPTPAPKDDRSDWLP